MLVDIGSATIDLDVNGDLALSDESLDDDMCALPQKIGYYAELMGECYAHAMNMKHEMEVTEAGADQAIRALAKEVGEKVTEPAIKQQISRQDNVRDARRAYYAADGQHKTIEGVYRALRDKANLAIAICYKQKEEIRVMNSPLN
jgi:hypothetical protein